MSPGVLHAGQPVPGPVGIRQIARPDDDKKLKPVRLPDGKRARNRVRTKRVLDDSVAGTVTSLLQGVVKNGTGTRAQLGRVPVAGKTGTTENYGDAWFVGWTHDYTVAVWVGYPNKLVPMETEFNGEPVAGGTYPAGIWKTFWSRCSSSTRAPELQGGRRTRAESPAPGEGRPAPAAPAPTPPPAARPAVARRPPRTKAARARAALGVPPHRRRRDAGDPGSGPPAPAGGTPRPAGGTAPPRRARSRRGASVSAQPRRPGPRDEARAGRAEAPRQLGRLRDPDPRAGEELVGGQPAGGGSIDRPVSRSVPFRSSPIPSAWVSLPGPEHRSASRSSPRRARMVDPSWGSSARTSTAAPTPSASGPR